MNADPRLVGAMLRSDFYSFIRATFPIVSPSSAFAPNWHIEAIAFALMRVLRGEIKRLIITVPPRSLKSICASVAFPAFVLGHDPTRRIICVSYAEALARKHANDCRALMRSTTIACSRTPGSAMPKTPNWSSRPPAEGTGSRPRSGAPSPAAAATSSSLMTL